MQKHNLNVLIEYDNEKINPKVLMNVEVSFREPKELLALGANLLQSVATTVGGASVTALQLRRIN